LDRGTASDAEFRSFADEHLRYEVAMFRWPRLVPRELPSDRLTWTVHQALFEAPIAHARTLIDFLYPRPGARETDLRASDFFASDSEWISIRPQLSSTLEMMRLRADKELSHLTVDRFSGTPPEKDWHEPWFDEIDRVVRVFARHASPARLSDGLRRFMLEDPRSPSPRPPLPSPPLPEA
jgi:hypothetical protein